MKPQKPLVILMEPSDENPLPLPPVFQTPVVEQPTGGVRNPPRLGDNETPPPPVLQLPGIRTKSNVVLDIPEEVAINPNDSGALQPTGGVKAPATKEQPAEEQPKKQNNLLKIVVAILVVIVLVRMFK